MGPLGPDLKLFITRLASGAHGGANGLVPLLLASPHGPDTAIRIALGQRHAEECEMRKTLSEGFWIVSTASSEASALLYLAHHPLWHHTGSPTWTAMLQGHYRATGG